MVHALHAFGAARTRDLAVLTNRCETREPERWIASDLIPSIITRASCPLSPVLIVTTGLIPGWRGVEASMSVNSFCPRATIPQWPVPVSSLLTSTRTRALRPLLIPSLFPPSLLLVMPIFDPLPSHEQVTEADPSSTTTHTRESTAKHPQGDIRPVF